MRPYTISDNIGVWLELKRSSGTGLVNVADMNGPQKRRASQSSAQTAKARIGIALDKTRRKSVNLRLEAGVGIEPAFTRLQVVSVSHSPSLPQGEGRHNLPSFHVRVNPWGHIGGGRGRIWTNPNPP